MNRTIRILTALVVVFMTVGAPAFSISAMAQEDTTQQAELEINQPHYVDGDVTMQSNGDSDIYVAEGEQLAIAPQNFDTENVVNYGVDVEEGNLVREDGFDHYTLEAGVNGTFELYWVTEEEVQDGNETVTETTRYEATVRVQGDETEHVAAGTLAQYEEDASKWQEWESSLESEFGQNVDIEEKTQVAFNLLRLRFNTLETVTGGQMLAIVVVLMSVSGLILLGIDRARELATMWPLQKEVNKRESLDAERKELDEVIDDYDSAKREQTMAKWKAGDIHDDERSAIAVSEAYGETARDIWVNYNEDMRYEHLIHDRLQALALCEYAVAVSWDENNEPSARLLKPDERADDGEWYVPLEQTVEENGSERTVNHVNAAMEILDLSDDALFEDRLVELDFDRDKLETRTEAPATIDEMIELVDEDRDLFEDKEQYAQAMLEFVEDVYHHPYTDEDGREDSIRAALTTFFKQAAYLGDRHLVPLAQLQKERLELALELHDPVAEAKTTLKKSEEGRYV